MVALLLRLGRGQLHGVCALLLNLNFVLDLHVAICITCDLQLHLQELLSLQSYLKLFIHLLLHFHSSQLGLCCCKLALGIKQS